MRSSFTFLSTPVLLAALGATGCVVPQNRYDSAVANARNERAAHLRAETELANARSAVARAEQLMAEREKKLGEQDGQLAETKLEAERAATEREDASAIVEQLRGELARVGDHLREYSDQKRTLETALSEAEVRGKRLDGAERQMGENMLVVRDVTLALGEAVAGGTAGIAVSDGKPAVRLEARTAFEEKGGRLAAPAATSIERLGAVLAKRKGLKIEVADRSTGDGTPEDRIVRLQQVVDALGRGGLGMDSVGLALPPDEGGKPSSSPPASGDFRQGPGSIEFVVSVADPS